jgi:hypothetical protein
MLSARVLALVRRRFLIALLPLAIYASACGGGGAKSNGEAKKPAGQVVEDAQQAALAAKGVHVTGHIIDNGVPLSLDLHLGRDRGRGRMSEAKLAFEIERIGDKIYLRGSEAFLRRFAGAAVATLLRDKWLQGSATSGSLAALAPLADARQLFKTALGSHGTLANNGETTYKGQTAVAIKDMTQGGTLYVAATGTPYPIALRGGKEQGSLAFDSWDESVTVTAPKGAIDISKLGG